MESIQVNFVIMFYIFAICFRNTITLFIFTKYVYQYIIIIKLKETEHCKIRSHSKTLSVIHIKTIFKDVLQMFANDILLDQTINTDHIAVGQAFKLDMKFGLDYIISFQIILQQ